MINFIYSRARVFHKIYTISPPNHTIHSLIPYRMRGLHASSSEVTWHQVIQRTESQLVDKVIRHNPPLPGLPVHALPVLNHDRIDHNTKPMEHWCTATVAWSSYYCTTSSLCQKIELIMNWIDHAFNDCYCDTLGLSFQPLWMVGLFQGLY